MVLPLDEAAPTSELLARLLDMPIWAVPSMIAAIPVVDPSAAMSKVVPGCCHFNCSASCGTNLAPSVSEPLMTRRSALTLETLDATSARPTERCLIFIGFGWIGLFRDQVLIFRTSRSGQLERFDI